MTGPGSDSDGAGPEVTQGRAGASVHDDRGTPDVASVSPYRPEDRSDWDAFVHAHPEAWIGHSSKTAELEELQGAINRSLVVRDNRDRIAAILPLFEVKGRRVRYVPVKSLCSGSHFCSGPLIRTGLSRKQGREIDPPPLGGGCQALGARHGS